jgi:hypothetical protein
MFAILRGWPTLMFLSAGATTPVSCSSGCFRCSTISAVEDWRGAGLLEVPFRKPASKELVIEPWFGVFVPGRHAGRDRRPPQLPPELCKFQRDADPG